MHCILEVNITLALKAKTQALKMGWVRRKFMRRAPNPKMNMCVHGLNMTH